MSSALKPNRVMCLTPSHTWLYRSARSIGSLATLLINCCEPIQAHISGADGRQDAPRWNMLQWLQYWNTRQLKQPGRSPQAERTKSVTSVEDEADSRDIRRR